MSLSNRCKNWLNNVRRSLVLSKHLSVPEIDEIVNDLEARILSEGESELDTFFLEFEQSHGLKRRTATRPTSVFAKSLEISSTGSITALTTQEKEDVLRLGTPRAAVSCWAALNDSLDSRLEYEGVLDRICVVADAAADVSRTVSRDSRLIAMYSQREKKSIELAEKDMEFQAKRCQLLDDDPSGPWNTQMALLKTSVIEYSGKLKVAEDEVQRLRQLLSEAEANKAEISEKLKIYKSVSSSAETKRGHLAAVADMQFKTQQMKKLKSLTKLDLLNVYEKFYSVVKQELVSRNFEQDLPDLFATLMGIFISNNVKSSLTLDFVQSTDSNPQPTIPKDSTCARMKNFLDSVFGADGEDEYDYESIKRGIRVGLELIRLWRQLLGGFANEDLIRKLDVFENRLTTELNTLLTSKPCVSATTTEEMPFKDSTVFLYFNHLYHDTPSGHMESKRRMDTVVDAILKRERCFNASAPMSGAAQEDTDAAPPTDCAVTFITGETEVCSTASSDSSVSEPSTESKMRALCVLPCADISSPPHWVLPLVHAPSYLAHLHELSKEAKMDDYLIPLEFESDAYDVESSADEIKSSPSEQHDVDELGSAKTTADFRGDEAASEALQFFRDALHLRSKDKSLLALIGLYYEGGSDNAASSSSHKKKERATSTGKSIRVPASASSATDMTLARPPNTNPPQLSPQHSPSNVVGSKRKRKPKVFDMYHASPVQKQDKDLKDNSSADAAVEIKASKRQKLSRLDNSGYNDTARSEDLTGLMEERAIFDDETVRQIVKNILKLGISQSHVAKASDLSPLMLNKWLKGATKEGSVASFEGIGASLNVWLRKITQQECLQLLHGLEDNIKILDSTMLNLCGAVYFNWTFQCGKSVDTIYGPATICLQSSDHKSAVVKVSFQWGALGYLNPNAFTSSRECRNAVIKEKFSPILVSGSDEIVKYVMKDFMSISNLKRRAQNFKLLTTSIDFAIDVSFCHLAQLLLSQKKRRVSFAAVALMRAVKFEEVIDINNAIRSWFRGNLNAYLRPTVMEGIVGWMLSMSGELPDSQRAFLNKKISETNMVHPGFEATVRSIGGMISSTSTSSVSEGDESKVNADDEGRDVPLAETFSFPMDYELMSNAASNISMHWNDDSNEDVPPSTGDLDDFEDRMKTSEVMDLSAELQSPEVNRLRGTGSADSLVKSSVLETLSNNYEFSKDNATSIDDDIPPAVKFGRQVSIPLGWGVNDTSTDYQQMLVMDDEDTTGIETIAASTKIENEGTMDLEESCVSYSAGLTGAEAQSEHDQLVPFDETDTKIFKADKIKANYNYNTCETCRKTGTLLCCDSCCCAYHLRCCKMKKVPENEDWFCVRCRESGAMHNIVVDESEKDDSLCGTWILLWVHSVHRWVRASVLERNKSNGAFLCEYWLELKQKKQHYSRWLDISGVKVLKASVSEAEQAFLDAEKSVGARGPKSIKQKISEDGEVPLDAMLDTYISPESVDAAMCASAVACRAVDIVMENENCNAFCCIRPPGHHAGRYGYTQGCMSTGFCLLNNAAIAMVYSRVRWGLQRVAVVDLDVHHGNGTAELLRGDPRAFFACTHMIHGDANDGFHATGIKPQYRQGFYPNKLGATEIMDNYVSVGIFPKQFVRLYKDQEMSVGSLCGPSGFHYALKEIIIPKLREFDPELLIISAGFDAYESDPIGCDMGLKLQDFTTATNMLQEVMEDRGGSGRGRIVSLMEGGYDTNSDSLGLATCVEAHIAALQNQSYFANNGKDALSG